MQRLSQSIWPLGWHPGGLSWWLGRAELPPAEIAVVRAGGQVSGWSAFSHGDELTVDADPEQPEVARELVGWIVDRAGSMDLTILVPAAHDALRAAVEEAGFAPDPGAPWAGLWLDASAARAASPSGYTVRAVRPGEERERVEVHRSAWLPAALPYPPDRRSDIAPGATSSFTEAACDRLRTTWLYDPDLDLVAVAPDGSMAACCVGWFDPVSGVTEVEPLGVDPEHRRRGLAGALCLEVAARTAERGGREVFINTGPSAAYPAPELAYRKAGFRSVTRGAAYRRPKV